jgi:hypothetical protein
MNIVIPLASRLLDHLGWSATTGTLPQVASSNSLIDAGKEEKL